MKNIKYYSETDTLYINVSNDSYSYPSLTSVESKEICENVIVDFDKNGNIVGIEIDNLSYSIATISKWNYFNDLIHNDRI